MFKLQDEKYFVLPNSTIDKYSHIDTSPIHLKYDIPIGKKIVPLIGYFSEDRGRKMFFEAIGQKPDGIQFVVAGALRDNDDIAFFKSHSNVSFLGKLSYGEALSLMKQSLFVPMLCNPDKPNYKYAIPTKFYDSTMVGTPVLVSNGQLDVCERIMQNGLGFKISYNDTQAFLDLLAKLNKTGKSENTIEIRNYFIKNCDFGLFIPSFREFCKKIKDSDEVK
jgi:hypothetical protein